MAPAQSTLVHDAPPSTRPSNASSPMTKKVSNMAASYPENVDVEQRRKNTLIELGQSVPQLPVEFFITKNGILPPLPSSKPGYLDGVLKALKKKKILRATNRSQPLRWKWFEHDPSGCPGKENVVFSAIDDIVKAIRQSSGIDRKPTLNVMCNPDMAPVATARNNKTRPDCYGLLSDTGNTNIPSKDENGRPYWISIGVPGEFKKDTSDAVRNWTQILWSMNYVFQEDPRRRFVFAFTIEDANMRIWFASRSDVLVSLPFDFNLKHAHMVEFFLRVMYAEEEQLGWDTTMERLPAEGTSEPFQYKINCAGVMYKTVRSLSTIGAEAIRGRGTRVWEVVEIQEDGRVDPTPRVLKDVWVDQTRKREAQILEEVRTAAEAKGLLKDFERHFMQVRRSGDVFIGKLPALDHTHQLILQGRSLDFQNKPLKIKVKPRKKSKKARKALEKKAKAAPQDAPTGVDKGPADPVEKILQYEPKVHHRIVFEELGCTITQVDTLSGALSAISDAMRGLQMLHQCGWVHRDISTGNILVVNGVGKLSDLEYAKHETDKQSHGIRTGTPYFMATEVDQQRFRHVPRALFLEQDLGDLSDVDELEARPYRARVEGDADATRSEPATSVAPSSVDDDSDEEEEYDPNDFKQNPLHDVESVLWVIVWILVCSKFLRGESKMSDEEWAKCVKSHEQFSRELFQNEVYRADAIDPGASFAPSFNGLLPRVRFIANKLVTIQVGLLDLYHSAYVHRHTFQKDPPFATVGGNLLQAMIRVLDAHAKSARAKGKDLKIDISPESDDEDEDEEEDEEEAKEEDEEEADQPSQVDPQVLPSLLSKRQSSEAEPLQRKRRKASDSAVVATPVAGTSRRMTRSRTSNPKH